MATRKIYKLNCLLKISPVVKIRKLELVILNWLKMEGNVKNAENISSFHKNVGNNNNNNNNNTLKHYNFFPKYLWMATSPKRN